VAPKGQAQALLRPMALTCSLKANEEGHTPYRTAFHFVDDSQHRLTGNTRRQRPRVGLVIAPRIRAIFQPLMGVKLNSFFASVLHGRTVRPVGGARLGAGRARPRRVAALESLSL